MLRGWTAGLAAARLASRSSHDVPALGLRRWPTFAGIGAAAYLLALVATIPARFAVDLGPRWTVSGTIWNGEAVLDGAWRAEWRWAPWRSLAALAFSGDVRITGTATDMAGTVAIWRQHKLFENLAGRADGTLLHALAPGSPFSCDGALQIDLRRLMLAGAESDAIGELRADNVSCFVPGGVAPAGLPPLIVRAIRQAGTTVIDAAPVGQPRVKLVQGGIANGRLRLASTPAGWQVQPVLRALVIDEAL